MTGVREKEVFMQERTGIITMKGNPLTLIGNEVKVGDVAPTLSALDNSLSPVRLSSFKGKICVLASVPSLDTPVCDLETRRFNEEAVRLGRDTCFSNHQHGPPICPETLVRSNRCDKGSDPLGPPRCLFWDLLWRPDQRTSAPRKGRFCSGSGRDHPACPTGQGGHARTRL